jgi:RNA polymerase sigma factor (sigma-70 family)
MSPRIPTGLLAAQSDKRLLELVRRGHERAFEALVQRYRRPLLRYCARMGITDGRAEDVLQNALLQAWLALERGVVVREPRAWLYRIVHNTAVNLMRSSREDHGPLSDGAVILAASTAAESALERRVAVHDTLTEVAALPQMQREAILLSAVDGRSHEEVATVLGVTDGAVRGLLYRARVTLRAAAAALTPQPLISWACGSMSASGPTAERLAELSVPAGAAGMTGVLLKGATMAVTAAVLVGGAAVAPLQHRTKGHASSARPGRALHATAAVQSQSSPAGASGDGLTASTGTVRALGAPGGAGASHRPRVSATGAPIRLASPAPATLRSHDGRDLLESGHGPGGSDLSGSSGSPRQSSHDGSGAEVPEQSSLPGDRSGSQAPTPASGSPEHSGGSADALSEPSSAERSAGDAALVASDEARREREAR